jgi:hypothetical protein
MNRRTEEAVLAVAVVLLTACATPLWGQAVASAQISGQVTDPTGAAVPTAQVTARQAETGQVRTTNCGPDGIYALPNLPVGLYKLEVQATGFETYVQDGIHLQVGENPTVDVRLQLGQVSQQVAVTANANMVQTQSTSVSQVVDQRSMVDLPLNGRTATELVMLVGAANDIGPANESNEGDLTSSKNYFNADSISVAGGQANGTNYLLDGGLHTDDWSNVNLPFPFPDALQEFSVQTSTLSTRYGLRAGATVNAVTKSGTNQFHGDAFEFVRNGDFNARDFFAATQDTLKRNQFGGTIGAPILKDKLFGFFGYQGTRIRTAPPSSIAYVPTQAELNGDFSQRESAACQASGIARTIVNPATGQAFTNDFVSPSVYNQQAVNLLKYVPISSNPCGELTYAIPRPQREDQYIGRVDWNQSAKHNFFGRYFFADYGSPAQFSTSNILLAGTRGVLDRAQSMVLGDTYTISSTTLNSVHLTYTRLAITRGPAPDMIDLTTIGVKIFQPYPNFMFVNVPGSFNVGCGSCSPSYFRQNNNQYADDLDIIRGRHHISVGGEWVHYRYDFGADTLGNGEFSFTGQFSNDALVDFMLGLPDNFLQGNPKRFDARENYIGAYVEDGVRLTKRFNIQLGLRWEPFLPVREIDNRMQHFDQAAFSAGKTSTQFDNPPQGLFFPGDAGMPSGLSYNRLRILEPRVGLVWDPTGSGRQTIRAGYGIFYSAMDTAYADNQVGDAPWGSQISLVSPTGGFTNPFLGYPGGNPFPSPSPPARDFVFPSAGIYYNFPLDIRPTYTQQWNLSYQVQLRNSWLFSATYIGNKTTHIWTSEDANGGVYIPGLCNGAPCSTEENVQQRRVLSLINPVAGSMYADIVQGDDGANAEYDGLLLAAQHRLSNHYTLLTNYTYSHCISETDYEGDMGGVYTQNPYNRNADRGNCGFDLRHIFNASFVADTPRFVNPWANRLLGNWQLAPIVSLHSGTWFSPWTGTDNSLTGIGMDRPNAIGNPYVRSTTGALQWITPNAFVPNALGTFGNAGADALLGPGYVDVDVAVSRYFNIKEKQRVELRFEFFNVFNHVNFNAPDNYLTDPTFGQILGDVSPRILQFALKYTF